MSSLYLICRKIQTKQIMHIFAILRIGHGILVTIIDICRCSSALWILLWSHDILLWPKVCKFLESLDYWALCWQISDLSMWLSCGQVVTSVDDFDNHGTKTKAPSQSDGKIKACQVARGACKICIPIPASVSIILVQFTDLQGFGFLPSSRVILFVAMAMKAEP